MDNFHPRDGVTLDDLAGFLQEFVVECHGEEAEVLCRYTRRIRIKRRLTKQILRAKTRGFYRDHSKLPAEDSRRSRLDLLATVIDKQLEKMFWDELIEFMVIRPSRNVDSSSPQTAQAPANFQISIPSTAGSKERF